MKLEEGKIKKLADIQNPTYIIASSVNVNEAGEKEINKEIIDIKSFATAESVKNIAEQNAKLIELVKSVLAKVNNPEQKQQQTNTIEEKLNLICRLLNDNVLEL